MALGPGLFLVGVVHPVEQPRPQLPAVLQALGHGGAHLGVALRHGDDVEGGEPYLAAGLERVDDLGPEPLERLQGTGLQGAGPGVRFADGPRHLRAEVVHGGEHRRVEQRLGRAVVGADRGEVGARGRDDVPGGGVRSPFPAGSGRRRRALDHEGLLYSVPGRTAPRLRGPRPEAGPRRTGLPRPGHREEDQAARPVLPHAALPAGQGLDQVPVPRTATAIKLPEYP
jgi:hypothetical protein